MMDGLEAILRRPRAVISLMFVMILAGFYCYISLAKVARPDIQVPTFYIFVPLEGVSP